MCSRSHSLRAVGFGVLLLSLVTGSAGGQPPQGLPPDDGLLRTELSLNGRTAVLAYAPGLRSDDPARKGVVLGTAAERVPLGHIVTTGTLRLSGVTFGKPDPSGIRFDVALEGTGSSWQLNLTDSTGVAVGQIALNRQRRSVASPTFIAALVPEAWANGRLIVRWGEYEGTADLAFTDRAELTRLGSGRSPVNRDKSQNVDRESRNALLNQRNESALKLPDGRRINVLFPRTSEETKGIRGHVSTGFASTSGMDFAALMKTPDGAVVRLLESAIPKLRTETPLRFGKALVTTENLAPGFPGWYGIWLKRVGTGWRLVLNHQPSVWGSQHDPKFDAAEVDLTYSDGHDPQRPLAAAIEPMAGDRGRLLILWGPHQWSTEFAVAQESAPSRKNGTDAKGQIK